MLVVPPVLGVVLETPLGENLGQYYAELKGCVEACFERCVPQSAAEVARRRSVAPKKSIRNSLVPIQMAAPGAPPPPPPMTSDTRGSSISKAPSISKVPSKAPSYTQVDVHRMR